MRAATRSDPGNRRDRTQYALDGLRWGLLPEEAARLEVGEERTKQEKSTSLASAFLPPGLG